MQLAFVKKKGSIQMDKPVLEIDVGKPTKLKFENIVTGSESIPSSFLTIKINENISLQIKGKDKKDNGKLISEIVIPPIGDYFKKTTLTETKLWVKVSNSIFTPWKSKVKIIEPISVESCKFESEKENIQQPNVTLLEVKQEEGIVEKNNNMKKKFNISNFKKNLS